MQREEEKGGLKCGTTNRVKTRKIARGKKKRKVKFEGKRGERQKSANRE